MILRQIRRDHAWRVFPAWGPGLILNMLLCASLVSAMAARRESVSTWPLLVLGWATVGLYLALGRPGRRGDLFDLALPIPARRIWLAHYAATVLGGTILVAGCVAVAALVSGRAAGGVSTGPDLLTFGLLLESGTLLAAALIQVPKPSLLRVPASAGQVAWIAFALLVELVLLIALAGAGPAGAAVLLVLAAGTTAWTCRTVPEAFVTVPREPRRGPARPAEAAAPGLESAASTGPARGTIFLATLRCLSAGAKELAIYPFVIIFGFLIGGGMQSLFDEVAVRDLRYLYLPMATYLLLSFMGPRLTFLQQLDPLPLSRRLLFAGLMLPTVLAFAVSYGAGALSASRHDAGAEYVDFRAVGKEKKEWYVTVPLRVFRFAPEGGTPAVTSPWGESHPAEGTPLFKGSGTVLYSPYEAPPGSSAKFVALQISRAARKVYGVTIPPEEVERRWLETRSDGTVAGKSDSLSLRAGRPGLRVATGPLFPVLTALICVPWLLLTAAFLRTYRPGFAAWARHAAYWGGLGLLLVGFLALNLVSLAGWIPFFLARALVEIPLWRLADSLPGTLAAWGASVLLLFGSYLLAEREFRRMEIPAKSTRYTLLKISQDEP